MVKTVITKIGKKKLCEAHAGKKALPKITKIAFGKGGVNADGTTIEPTGDEVSLRSELLRKDIAGYAFVEETTCRYSVKIEKSELADEFISEQALIDADGDVVAYATYLPKAKDDGLEMIFEMDEIF